jgi:hypothetical protein
MSLQNNDDDSDEDDDDNDNIIKKHEHSGLSPRVNYTDRATAACRLSQCQLLRIEGATCGQRDGSLRPYSRSSRPE